MATNPKVREDIGKAAVTRGPIVYCMEEVDNGKDLHLVSLNASAGPEVCDESICGIPTKTIKFSGFRREMGDLQGLYQPWKAESRTLVSLKFIPYYMWANRMENEMQVWVRME